MFISTILIKLIINLICDNIIFVQLMIVL